MIDRDYNKIEEKQEARVEYMGHMLDVDIYEVENEKVFFRTINCKVGQPRNGYFNRVEASRYLRIKK